MRKKLRPGYNWSEKIEEAVEVADAVIVFLSNNSVTKEGVVQKEIRRALDKAEEKPDDVIFIIPLRLEEDCFVPKRLKSYQYQDYFDNLNTAYKRLCLSLEERATSLDIDIKRIYENYKKIKEEEFKKKREDQIQKEIEEEVYAQELDKIRKKIREEKLRELEEQERANFKTKFNNTNNKLQYYKNKVSKYPLSLAFSSLSILFIVLSIFSMFYSFSGTSNTFGTLSLVLCPSSIILSMVGIYHGIRERNLNTNKSINGLLLSVITLLIPFCLFIIFLYIDANFLWCNFFPFLSGC